MSDSDAILEIKNPKYKMGENIFPKKDISAFFKCGDWVLVTGPSGSGKTTLLEMILGFREPEKGEILVADAGTRHESISYVPQHTFLFDQTIRDNVVADAPLCEMLYEKVMRTCQLEEFANRDERIGINGLTLSGGQRQRIAIARALYASRKIVLFDESFSGVSKIMEAEILADIKNQFPFLLVIMISHSTINEYEILFDSKISL